MDRLLDEKKRQTTIRVLLRSASSQKNSYELLKIIPAESGSIQSCRNPVQTPYGWTDYISHVGSIWHYRSVVDAGLIAGESGNKQGRQTCFFAARRHLNLKLSRKSRYSVSLRETAQAGPPTQPKQKNCFDQLMCHENIHCNPWAQHEETRH